MKNLFEEIMTENFPNLVQKKYTQVHKAWRVPNKTDPMRPTPRHSIIKMAYFKDKDRILKAAREKQLVTYKGAPIKLSSDFSTDISGQNGLG